MTDLEDLFEAQLLEDLLDSFVEDGLMAPEEALLRKYYFWEKSDTGRRITRECGYMPTYITLFPGIQKKAEEAIAAKCIATLRNNRRYYLKNTTEEPNETKSTLHGRCGNVVHFSDDQLLRQPAIR